MAIDRDDRDERQARIEWMMNEFEEARRRQLVKRGIALWTRTETAEPNPLSKPNRPVDKLN